MPKRNMNQGRRSGSSNTSAKPKTVDFSVNEGEEEAWRDDARQDPETSHLLGSKERRRSDPAVSRGSAAGGTVREADESDDEEEDEEEEAEEIEQDDGTEAEPHSKAGHARGAGKTYGHASSKVIQTTTQVTTMREVTIHRESRPGSSGQANRSKEQTPKHDKRSQDAAMGELDFLEVYHWLILSTSSEQSTLFRLRNYGADVQAQLAGNGPAAQLVHNDPTKVRLLSKMLRYVGEALITKRVQRPVVFIVAAHSQEPLDSFLRYISELFASHSIEHPEIYLAPPTFGSGWSKKELEERIQELVNIGSKSNDGVALLLREIGQLEATAPLVLQSIADPESSPYMGWGLTIIATTHLTDPGHPPVELGEGEKEIQGGNCDAEVTDHLLNSWRDGLSEDKIYPIVSRISAILLCLD